MQNKSKKSYSPRKATIRGKLLTTNHSLNKGGFTLIEILVSLTIFILIIGGIVMFSVRTIQAHTRSQAMQNAIENARFAIESINKKIRTSHAITDGSSNNFTASNEVFIIDNVDSTKYCYQFDSTNKTLTVSKLASTDAGYDDPSSDSCSSSYFPASVPVVGGDASGRIEVSGNFYVKNSDEANYQRGFVRTVIAIQYNDPAVPPAEQDSFVIQSGVSVRDY